MRRTRNRLGTCLGILLLGLMLGCSGPMGPIPGGELEGPELPWPDSWAFTDEQENVLLETRPEDPYSVTVLGVYVDRTFYVAGVSEDNKWVQHILRDGNVRLGVGGDVFRGRASLVNDERELRPVGDQYTAKYDIDTGEESTFFEDGGVIIRITAP